VKTKTLFFVLVMLSSASFAGATTHVVKSGDNLYRIAQNYGVSLKQLQSANPGASVQSLRIGQKLTIPTSRAAAPLATSEAPLAQSSSAPAPRAGASGTYEVKAGDNLSKIAQQQGTTLAQLQAANPNLNPHRLGIGQVIQLPESAAKASESSATLASSYNASPAPAAIERTEPAEQSVPPVAKEEPAPAPQPATVAEMQAPVKEATPEPVSTPQTVNNPTTEPAAQPAASTYRLIKTTRELTLAEVAKENNTTTDKINALNGWSFSPQTLLAVDSELYIPAQP
jgi:LysM repeat protein